MPITEIDRKLFDDVFYDTPELKREVSKSKLYGVVPGDWLPNWVKQGYNNSIEGMARQVYDGKPIFKVDEDYDPGIVEDVLATVMSFATPTDAATLLLGGGLGGAAVKKFATKNLTAEFARRQAVKSGLEKTAAARLVKQATPKVMNTARARAVTGATQLGFYSGLASSLGQEITDGDIDFVKTLKDSAKGATLGALTGATAVKTNQYAVTNNLTPKQTVALQKTAEIGVFGTTQPLLEGSLPSAQDYVHAAGVIGGLTLKSKLTKGLSRAPIDKIRQYEARQELRGAARKEAEQNASRKRLQETWTNGKKEVKILSDWQGDHARDTHIKIQDIKTNEISQINRKEFFQTGNYRRAKDSFGNDFATGIRKKIFGLKSKLNISDKDFKEMVDKASGKEYSLKKSGKKSRQYRTNYQVLNNEGRNKLLISLETKQKTNQVISDYNKSGIEVNNTTGGSLLKQSIPERFYNAITGRVKAAAKKAEFTYLPVDKVIDNPIGRRIIKTINDLDLTNATLFTRLNDRLANATYTARDGKKYTFQDLASQELIKGVKGGIKSGFNRKKLRQELADDLESTNPKDIRNTKEIRDVLNLTYRASKRAGIDVAPFLDNYFPKIIKPKILKKIYDDIDRFVTTDPYGNAQDTELKPSIIRNLEIAMRTGRFSDETVSAINHIVALKLNQRQQGTARTRPLSRSEQMGEAFQILKNQIHSERVVTNKMLEKARKDFILPKEFYERDAGLVLTNYLSQASKRMSYVKHAGANGERVFDRLNALRKQPGGARQAEILEKAFNAQTGLIETDLKYNWNPRAKTILNEFVNVNVATKIGLGFATIPNLTQSFISTALSLGYAPMFKGTYKALTDKNYRRDIKKYSGAGLLELNQIILGFQPLASSPLSKLANVLTTASGFQGINKINKLISAFSAHEAALQWQRLATSKPTTARQVARRNFAIQNLRRMGITNPTKKITIKNSAKAMYEFSRDAQLQRNVLREPSFFNTPKFQPFLLFKRFAYRQADLIIREANKAYEQKNMAFLFRLGMAGMFGGTFVNWAKDALTKHIIGVNVYDDSYSFAIDGVNYTTKDFIEGIGAVGALGYISDIIASESKWRALEFALKPVLIKDAETLYTVVQKVSKDIEEIGFNSITAQRSAKYFQPLLGASARRVLRTFETPKQRSDYRRTRLGVIKKEIFDSMLDGDDARVKRIILNWNNTFPERPLTQDDLSPSQINRYLERKYLRKELEFENKLPKRKKRPIFNEKLY
tara:strand:- start:285 stop:4046 length:3762 start_codon:yes stop_codon:yes gene_type:complete